MRIVLLIDTNGFPRDVIKLGFLRFWPDWGVLSPLMESQGTFGKSLGPILGGEDM